MSQAQAPSTKSRADSPAPRLAAGKVDSPCQLKKPSQPSSFSISNPDVKKDLATLAAIVMSTAALYGKSQALVSLANLCWQEEGAIIFCAKFVACVGLFVGCFGAVVYLWLVAMDKVAVAKKWSDYAKAALAAMISVWIICFGHAMLCYVQPELNMTAVDLYKIWFGSTLLAISVVSSYVVGSLISVKAYHAYLECHYPKAISSIASSVVAYALGYAIIHCFVFQSGTSMMTFGLLLGKCTGLALAVVGTFAVVFLCVRAVRQPSFGGQLFGKRTGLALAVVGIFAALFLCMRAVPQSSWLFLGKCTGLALVVMGIFAAIFLCMRAVRQSGFGGQLLVRFWWTVALPALIAATAGLAIHSVSGELSLGMRYFLYFSILTCAVCGLACIFCWRKLQKFISAQKKKAD